MSLHIKIKALLMSPDAKGHFPPPSHTHTHTYTHLDPLRSVPKLDAVLDHTRHLVA